MMDECLYIFDVDGVLLGKEKEKDPVQGMLLLKERAKKGKIVVITGRPLKERRRIVDELKSRGLSPGDVYQFIFRTEDEDPRSWKLRTLRNLAEEEHICEVHDDDELLLWSLKKDPLFKGTRLFVYVEGNPSPF